MRLIDADALREKRGYYKDGFLVPDPNGAFIDWDAIDAAPTVSCAECRWSILSDRVQRCFPCYCGSSFERRQP